MTSVAIVGGGIAGLAAAHELARGGDAGQLEITLLEGATLGGKLVSRELGGRCVDVGPDGYLARRPEATALISELGAEAQLEPVAASGASIYARGRLCVLPAGLAFGVPSAAGALRSREAIRLLGLAGALRASVDLVAPRRAKRSALPDRAIGPLVARKLGQRVVDVLVDPLVGGIHAGRVRDLSAAAVFPPVLAAGQSRGSLMRALRSPTADAVDGPAFLTLRDSLASVVEMLRTSLVARGVTIRTDAAVASLERGSAGNQRWVLDGSCGRLDADAVILATPAAVTRSLVTSHDRHVASMLSTIDTASVAVVTLIVRGDLTLPDTGTGVLIPSGTVLGDTASLTTAISFLDRKWPHLARDGEVLLRASVGRIDDVRFDTLDDADLVERVCAELSRVLGSDVAPRESLVTRWPDSFPQYRVNHLVRVDGIEAAIGALGGVAVAGSSYRGVGIPACIQSGRSAARSVRSWLAGQS